MSQSLKEQIRAIGDVFNMETIEQTRALYAKLVPSPALATCNIDRDVAYGPDPRHRLDVFSPLDDSNRSRPVLVFVHGGGFVAGDKGTADSPFFNNIGIWAAAQGFISINMTHRLAPGAQWPAGAEDVAAAVAWIADNVVGHYGGAADSVFMMGHSAGAVHVASYLTQPAFHRLGDPSLAGAILVSGVYAVDRARYVQHLTAYFGEDRSTYASRSSLAGLTETEVPLMFIVSEFDTYDFHHQAGLVIEAFLNKTDALPRLIYLSDHNHVSSTLQIGTADDSLGCELINFIRRFS
jgi:acetyl esterase/lipase